MPSSQPFLAYYNNSNKDYWIDAEKGWLKVSEGGLKRWLRKSSFSDQILKGKTFSSIDAEIIRIQTERRVDYAGPLAGWNKGLYSIYGQNVLITSSPKLITPFEGTWTFIEACHRDLLGRVDPKQVIIWMANQKIFLECLYNQYFRPGPANFLIGEKNCGKSFIQDRYTDTVGGRFADPWLFISGGTPFNEELFAAEHLKIADPNIFTTHERHDFSNMIKHFVADEGHSCHGKNSNAVSLPPRRRITASANRELHNIGVVPSLDPSMMDKMNLFLCAPHSIPPEGFKDIGYHEVVGRFQREIPAYVWHLLNEFKIPDDLKDQRCGVVPFHHPDLVDDISEQLIETRFLRALEHHNLLDKKAWSGTVTDLIEWLDSFSNHADIKPFLRNPSGIAHLLSKLEGRFPHRVKKNHTRTKNRRGGWIIYPEARN